MRKNGLLLFLCFLVRMVSDSWRKAVSDARNIGFRVKWFLTPKQLLMVAAYSAIMPVCISTNVTGLMVIGLILNIPFIPLGYVGTMAIASILPIKGPLGYAIGNFLAIFVQLYPWALFAANAYRYEKEKSRIEPASKNT